MPYLKLKRIAKVAVIFSGLFLAGCLFDQGDNTPSENGAAVIGMRVGLDPVNIVLSKTSTISLGKLIIVFTSNGHDTLRDTITSSTIPALNTSSTSPQVISKYYSLKPLRIWKAVVSVKDSRDSLIHKDSTTTPVLHVQDTAAVSLNLSSKFSMYQARYLTLPDSIGSPSAGTVKVKLNLNRLVLKIDDVIVCDSTATPGPYFASGSTHILSYDYVSAGSHSVQLLAYGPLNSWNTANPLYSGTSTINVTQGLDSTVAMTLNWVGPTTGMGSLSVTIGKMGAVNLTGNMSRYAVQ